MKNILLLVHDDPGQEARLQAALDLARALRGHLTCLHVTEMPVIPGEFFAASAEAMIASEREREEAHRARIQARLDREDVPWSWIDVSGNLTEALTDAARMADLVVVNRKLDSGAAPDMRALAGEVVIGAGRAVVVVPEQARGFAAGGLALVAWDGSEEAMNALRGAIPLLKLALAVTIAEVADGPVETPAEEAAAYLSRHDVRPVVVRRHRRAGTTADTLLAEARAEHADYVVMGGFGHSRLAEALFGGVSREMLTESPIPTVMAH